MNTTLENRLKEHNQYHLYEHLKSIKDETERLAFEKELNQLNFSHLNRIFKQSMAAFNSGIKVEPPQKKFILPLVNKEEKEKLTEEGLNIIATGKVGVLLLAGGQGTRLGFDHPKGMYILDLPSKKSLFQYQAEQIKKLELMVKAKNDKNVTIMWYIMTSASNEKETRNFFETNGYFGLKENQVTFFNQGSLPCFKSNGEIMIAPSKDCLATAPNGNGGIYLALEDEGILKHMEENGVEYIHSYCVDNVLTKVADPVFIAQCVSRKVKFGSKVIAKQYPEERVGVFAEKNGNMAVVEYSEIPKDMQNDPRFNEANIVNFYYSVKFLKECANVLAKYENYHIAHKSIPSLNTKTQLVEKQEGVKLELFNFDIVYLAKDQIVLSHVDRHLEFAPLKNKEGKDSPKTCVELLSNRNKKLIEQVGGSFSGEGVCEVSPLYSYNGESIPSKTYALPLHLE